MTSLTMAQTDDIYKALSDKVFKVHGVTFQVLPNGKVTVEGPEGVATLTYGHSEPTLVEYTYDEGTPAVSDFFSYEDILGEIGFELEPTPTQQERDWEEISRYLADEGTYASKDVNDYSESWSWATVRVWVSDRALFAVFDSGCSCNSFGDCMTVSDILRFQDFNSLAKWLPSFVDKGELRAWVTETRRVRFGLQL